MPKSIIEPKEDLKVIDLVSQAGLDISDWSNTTGSPAANPKYCYNWSFQQDNLIILNLWYEEIEEDELGLFRKFNIREVIKYSADNKSTQRKKRAQAMDLAIQKAHLNSLPVRALILSKDKTRSDKATAEKRMLDPEPWTVDSYDFKSGKTLLRRGYNKKPVNKYVDQFTLHEDEKRGKEDRKVSVFPRDRKVRDEVRERSQGKCEYCNQSGFKMANGSIYIETHHIVPLSEKGADNTSNVIALCPNHHMEAHHGENQQELRSEFQRIIAKLSNHL